MPKNNTFDKMMKRATAAGKAAKRSGCKATDSARLTERYGFKEAADAYLEAYNQTALTTSPILARVRKHAIRAAGYGSAFNKRKLRENYGAAAANEFLKIYNQHKQKFNYTKQAKRAGYLAAYRGYRFLTKDELKKKFLTDEAVETYINSYKIRLEKNKIQLSTNKANEEYFSSDNSSQALSSGSDDNSSQKCFSEDGWYVESFNQKTSVLEEESISEKFHYQKIDLRFAILGIDFGMPILPEDIDAFKLSWLFIPKAFENNYESKDEKYNKKIKQEPANNPCQSQKSTFVDKPNVIDDDNFQCVIPQPKLFIPSFSQSLSNNNNIAEKHIPTNNRTKLK